MTSEHFFKVKLTVLQIWTKVKCSVSFCIKSYRQTSSVVGVWFLRGFSWWATGAQTPRTVYLQLHHSVLGRQVWQHVGYVGWSALALTHCLLLSQIWAQTKIVLVWQQSYNHEADRFLTLVLIWSLKTLLKSSAVWRLYVHTFCSPWTVPYVHGGPVEPLKP